MQPFKTLTSQVIPFAMKNVDTDMIIPAQYLTQINREGYGKFLFQSLREHHPDFIFNQTEYRDANILLTQSNFGCGSSREHAVWALQQAGIKAIIADSFSDIFFNNAAKNGLLLIILSIATIDSFFKMAKKTPLMLTINLEDQVIKIEKEEFHFDYDAFRKTCLLNGYDDIDYLLNYFSKGET